MLCRQALVTTCYVRAPCDFELDVSVPWVVREYDCAHVDVTQWSSLVFIVC